MPTDFNPDYVETDDIIEDFHVNDLRDAVNALEKGASFFAAATGTDAYAVTFVDPFVGYSAGMLVNFQAANANTGPVTLNVDSLGAKNVVKPDGTALQAGDVSADQVVTVIFDAVNDQFQVVGGIGSSAGGAQSLDQLSDVSIVGTPAAGEILRHDGTDFTNEALDTDLVPEGTNLYYTDARARDALSAAAPMAYNDTTGEFSMPQASGSQSGFLSSSDWTTFNNKTGPGHTHSSADITDTMPASKGGTGQSSYTAGDLLHATGASTLGKLGVGSDGQVLKVVSGAPTWAAESAAGASSLDELSDVDLTAPSSGHILRHDGSEFVNQALSTDIVPEGNNLYHTDARARNALSAASPMAYNASTGEFSMPQASGSQSGFLSSTDWTTFNSKAAGSHQHAAGDITSGTLGVARGGTGIGSFTTGNFMRAAGASSLEQRTPAQVLSDIGAAAASHTHAAGDITSGTLGVARGGTGIGSFTIGNFMRAAGASSLEQRTPAQVLSDIGAAAASHTHAAGDITSGTLGVARGGTGLGSYVTGDLLYASGSSTLARRSIGSNGQVLKVVGGVPTWANESTGVSGSGFSGRIAFWSGTSTLSSDILGWDSSNNRLGIGTLAPAYTLHCNGTAAANLANLSGGQPVYIMKDGTNRLVFLYSWRQAKSDIQALPFDMDDLMRLTPRKFRWKQAYGGGEDIGLIAEEVAQVIPVLATRGAKRTVVDEETGEVLRDDHGNAVEDPSQMVPSGVRYEQLTVYLLAAVQRHERLLRELLGSA